MGGEEEGKSMQGQRQLGGNSTPFVSTEFDWNRSGLPNQQFPKKKGGEGGEGEASLLQSREEEGEDGGEEDEGGEGDVSFLQSRVEEGDEEEEGEEGEEGEEEEEEEGEEGEDGEEGEEGEDGEE